MNEDSHALRSVKVLRIYEDPLMVALASGCVAALYHLDVQPTFPAELDAQAWPEQSPTEWAIEHATAYVSDRFAGPAPRVLLPEPPASESAERSLPSSRLAAQLFCFDPVADDGEFINLIWFAEIDDRQSLYDLVAEGVGRLEWRLAASNDPGP